MRPTGGRGLARFLGADSEDWNVGASTSVSKLGPQHPPAPSEGRCSRCPKSVWLTGTREVSAPPDLTWFPPPSWWVAQLCHMLWQIIHISFKEQTLPLRNPVNIREPLKKWPPDVTPNQLLSNEKPFHCSQICLGEKMRLNKCWVSWCFRA